MMPIHDQSDIDWLRSPTRPVGRKGGIAIRSVDLFAGCGGLTLGVSEACRRAGLGHAVEFASEWDEEVVRHCDSFFPQQDESQTEDRNIINKPFRNI